MVAGKEATVLCFPTNLLLGPRNCKLRSMLFCSPTRPCGSRSWIGSMLKISFRCSIFLSCMSVLSALVLTCWPRCPVGHVNGVVPRALLSASIFTMLHAELPTASETCSASVHMLLCKCALWGDVPRRALGFLFYGILLAVERLLTTLFCSLKLQPTLCPWGLFIEPCYLAPLQDAECDGLRGV